MENSPDDLFPLYCVQLRRAEEEAAFDGADGNVAAEPSGSATPQAIHSDGCGCRGDDGALVRAATEAQRQRLIELRDEGTIGDAAFQRLEEELDWVELGWAQTLRAGQQSNENTQLLQ